MDKYIPSPSRWVAEQVELYEGSGGTDGTTLKGLPVIIVTNRGRKTGAIRKTPLMRVVDGNRYVLVASRGGAPKHPLWYHNIKANPAITIQVGRERLAYTAREVDADTKRELWPHLVSLYPDFDEYQARTDRDIPVFCCEPTAP
mgnify:CR=1 FL=1